MYYVNTGINRIAIALIAAGPTQTASTFDCAVRLMGDSTVSRIFDYSISSGSISGFTSTILSHHHTYYIYSNTCTDNYYQITFNDDRHEWISSVIIQLQYNQYDKHPRQFVFKAKNTEDSEWTLLKTVSGMTWSLVDQRTIIWIPNNKAYNMYRFENIGSGDSTSCPWRIGMIDLMSNAIQNEIPALSYVSTTIYKDIEMGEVYTNANYYYDFSVYPSLPNGIVIDPNTGTISETAVATTPSIEYTITAKKLTGEITAASFTMSVEICTGGKSLITLVARTDSFPEQSSYRLYAGKGKSTEPIQQIEKFPIANTLYYGDFCLNHGIYTLELRDTSTGWSNPGGYYLTVDIGEMKFEMGQVSASPIPASVTTMFSSYLPFQIEYDDWKINKSDNIPENWKEVDFDDSDWTVSKASEIGTSEEITTYIRRDIMMVNITDYQVLNVRVKYAGGIVCYFNGRKVARFNLEEDFNAYSQSIEVHDASIFSKFHIVLPTVGITEGKNVIAFEIHRPLDQSSSEPVIFDATGVFGVNECSIGVDSIFNVEGTSGTTIGNLENFFDLTPVTYGYQPNVVGTYLQWSV